MKKVHIGDATLYLGDCLEWLESLPECFTCDVVVMDPPYGVNLTTKKGRKGAIPTEAETFYQDDYDHVAHIVRSVMPQLLNRFSRVVCTPGTNMSWEYPKPDAQGVIYQSNGSGFNSWGFNCAHPIFYYGKCPYQSNGLGTRPTSMAKVHPGGHVTGEADIQHPCPKPIIWMNWLVDRASLPGETVCDPFMGSGTTGVACANLGRKFIGIEIEPKYFDIACERIEAAYSQGRLFA